MNMFKRFLVGVLLMPALLWAATNTPACDSNCDVLSQRLNKFDCRNSISEGRKFLLDGRKLVLTIPGSAPGIQNEIAALRNGLQSHRQTMVDCLNKHRANKEFSSAILPFMKADFAVEKLSETPNMSKHAQEMSIREYELAIETITKLSSK